MSERYLVTGVQPSLIKLSNEKARELLINDIIEQQFIGNSEKSIEDDVQRVLHSNSFTGYFDDSDYYKE